MTILGINVIALVLGLLLLAPRRDGHGHFWRYAREQARSELNATTQAARLYPDRRSGAASLRVEGAATAVAAREGDGGHSRLLRRITGPRLEHAHRS
jgi:hypothetical protein